MNIGLSALLPSEENSKSDLTLLFQVIYRNSLFRGGNSGKRGDFFIDPPTWKGAELFPRVLRVARKDTVNGKQAEPKTWITRLAKEEGGGSPDQHPFLKIAAGRIDDH